MRPNAIQQIVEPALNVLPEADSVEVEAAGGAVERGKTVGGAVVVDPFQLAERGNESGAGIGGVVDIFQQRDDIEYAAVRQLDLFDCGDVGLHRLQIDAVVQLGEGVGEPLVVGGEREGRVLLRMQAAGRPEQQSDGRQPPEISDSFGYGYEHLPIFPPV